MGQHWFVVLAKIKSADKAERNLRDDGFQTYAPFGKVERFSKRKKIWREVGYRMMGRYIFVLSEPGMESVINGVDGVDRMLNVGGCAVALGKGGVKALEQLRTAEADLQFDETRAGKLHRGEIGKRKKDTMRMRFPPGSRVLIKNGPFASFTAEVSSVNGRAAIKAMVEIFGGLSAVELNPNDVDPLDEIREAA